MLSLDSYVLLDPKNVRLLRVHVTFGLPFYKWKNMIFERKLDVYFDTKFFFPVILNIKFSNFSGYN